MRKRGTKPVMSAEENPGEAESAPFELDFRDLRELVGDEETLAQLFSATYEELRKLAGALRRRDPNATLSPTDLVHEAWLKLARSPGFAATSPLHFKRIAARAMRQVLVEAARRRISDKRGGGAAPLLVSVDAHEAPASSERVLALNTPLTQLALLDERQAQLVEGRFFGGLEIPEIARVLGVSETTAQRDWRAAKAWLATELG
jgi:RNA polymerase sigma factor (TIGR02999 family)